MSAELPPDVRDRAARAAQLSDAGGSWIPVWDSFHDENREYWRAIVDAVAGVLAADLGLMTREECDQKVDRLLARPILNETMLAFATRALERELALERTQGRRTDLKKD